MNVRPAFYRTYSHATEASLATRWTLIGEYQRAGADHALGQLIETYANVVYSYFRRARVAPERAEDLTHEFVYQKIYRAELFQKVQRKRGRVRAYLDRSVRNFLIDQWRADRSTTAGIDHVDLKDPRIGLDDELQGAFVLGLLREAFEEYRCTCFAVRRTMRWTIAWHGIVRPALEGANSPSREELATMSGLPRPESVDHERRAARSGLQLAVRRVFQRHASDDDALMQIVAQLLNSDSDRASSSVQPAKERAEDPAGSPGR